MLSEINLKKSIVESGMLDDLDNIFGIQLLPMDSAGVVGYHAGLTIFENGTFKSAPIRFSKNFYENGEFLPLYILSKHI
ncbi:hypothetical protein J7J00_17215 [Bacillus sp. ISL-4]|uniref:hypothetical protein n=1 Tax=Bacillus sp. ISL-4 TaxID=2819125 RepID=UPI001BE613BB|nr:hypothetical protein [Bacillus sp. ISL-4]MBT2667231.1 hypothetical protein [Bacillus sp. ISL-4]MBT2670562.1 hypothetical protein [Streptomyces sp. ISL-14]